MIEERKVHRKGGDEQREVYDVSDPTCGCKDGHHNLVQLPAKHAATRKEQDNRVDEGCWEEVDKHSNPINRTCCQRARMRPPTGFAPSSYPVSHHLWDSWGWLGRT
jgi:hypothetical protein